MKNRLQKKIIRLIRQSGIMPLAEYMHLCMADPVDGYYATRESIGGDGDFITAPEISQMFGELIGVWCIKQWISLGKPTPFNLVELGPGNGTLMADLLRAGKVSPEFLEAARTILIETSPRLKTMQEAALGNMREVKWLSDVSHLDDLPVIIIANEVLDALPVSQYVKQDGVWHERSVTVDNKDNLGWALSSTALQEDLLPLAASSEPDGSVYEISPAREALVGQVGQIVLQNSGTALFIDYGHFEHGFGDTLQAVRDHEYADPLTQPGQTDLTSHVDFGSLAKIIDEFGLNSPGLHTQGNFLLSLGLLERTAMLGSNKDEAVRQRLKQEAERLALPSRMGNLFKVLIFSTADDQWPFDQTANLQQS